MAKIIKWTKGDTSSLTSGSMDKTLKEYAIHVRDIYGIFNDHFTRNILDGRRSLLKEEKWMFLPKQGRFMMPINFAGI